MTGSERADGEVCSGAVAACLLSATRLRCDAIYFRYGSPQMRLDPLSQGGSSHVAVRAITAHAKVSDTRRGIEPHQLDGKRVNAEESPHPVKRGSNAILNLIDGAIAPPAKCAHLRKLKGRTRRPLCAISCARSGASVLSLWSVAPEKNARRLDNTVANFLERTSDERARRARVATAAEFTRELVHIHVARAAK